MTTSTSPKKRRSNDGSLVPGTPTRTRRSNDGSLVPGTPTSKRRSNEGSSQPHPSADLKRRGPRPVGFGHVVSMGTICLTARFLQEIGYRKYKGPFDWIYSSARMVRHCLSTDFKMFLNKTLMVNREEHGTGHELYSKMTTSSLRQSLWPHHRLLNNKEDFESFQRAVQRFRTLLRDKSRQKLFIMCHSVTSDATLAEIRKTGPRILARSKVGGVGVTHQGGAHLGSIEEVRHVWAELSRRAEGRCDLDVVYLVGPGPSEAKKKPVTKTLVNQRQNKGYLRVLELHCVGDNTGLFFREASDYDALRHIVSKGRQFNVTSIDGSSAQGLSDDKRKGKIFVRAARRVLANKLEPGKIKRRNKTGEKGRTLKRKRTFAFANREQKIKVQAKNPKKIDSMAYERYEKYQRAKTLGQYFELGGTNGDIHFDTSKGYVKILKG